MCRLRKMLMLLSVHVTSVLFLVLAGNFALTLVARSYALLDMCTVRGSMAMCSKLFAEGEFRE